jgi:hypothetical protein
VRSGIDELDHGVFFRGIEVLRLHDDPIDVECPIPILCHKWLWHLPLFFDRTVIGFAQRFEKFAIFCATQLIHGRVIDARPTTNIVVP